MGHGSVTGKAGRRGSNPRPSPCKVVFTTELLKFGFNAGLAILNLDPITNQDALPTGAKPVAWVKDPEPPRRRQILNLVRLPIPPHPLLTMRMRIG